MTGDLQPAPLQVDEPLPLGPDDAVPLLRADLVVQRGKSPGLFQVADPASGRAFTLYEFELSIARMLDGRRRAAELVEAGARLGIPVDLAGLHKFVRQLWHYGFLAPAGAEPAAPPEGGGREAWDEATRALYQTGLRLVHLGRPGDAAAYFEAILDGHPGHPEATELLAAIAQGRTIPATPIGDGGERVPVDAAAPPATTAGAAGSPRPRRALAIAIAAGVVVAALAGGAFAALRTAPPRPAVAPPAPAPAATPPAPAAPPPAPEPAPPPLPRWRTAPLERRWRPAVADVAAPADGIVAWRRDLAGLVKAGDRLGLVRVPGAPAPLAPAAAKRLAELARLAKGDPIYGEFLEKEREKLQRVRSRGQELPLAAPAAGTLRQVAADGARVSKGDRVAQLLDAAAWHLAVRLPGEPPAPDAECELAGDARDERAPCRVVEVAAPESGAVEVTVALEAKDAPWLERALSPYVRLAPAARAP